MACTFTHPVYIGGCLVGPGRGSGGCVRDEGGSGVIYGINGLGSTSPEVLCLASQVVALSLATDAVAGVLDLGARAPHAAAAVLAPGVFRPTLLVRQGRS